MAQSRYTCARAVGKLIETYESSHEVGSKLSEALWQCIRIAMKIADEAEDEE